MKTIKRKRKMILGTILALSLAMIIAVAAVIPALAHHYGKPTPSNAGVEYVYFSGGNVEVQLPAGGGELEDRPTNLILGTMDVSKRSTKGAEDGLIVSVWVPERNRYAYVAIINDNPVAVASITAVFAGMPVSQNIILVEDEDIEVWKRGDVITVNLTKAIDIEIGDPAPPFFKALNFTLPPLTMEIRGFDSTFREENSGAFPSGWTFSTTAIRKPAWVRVWIPEWLGPGQYRRVGIMAVRATSIYTPPQP